MRLHVSCNGMTRVIVEVGFSNDDAQDDVLAIHAMRRLGPPGGPYEPAACRLDLETDS